MKLAHPDEALLQSGQSKGLDARMSIVQLILKEMALRKVNAALAVLATTVAVALYVGFHTTGTAADRETTRLMRDLGFNLRIIPMETDETDFWAQGYATETIPHEYVYRFSEQKGLSYRHLLATLQQQIAIDNVPAMLTGIDSEVSPPDGKKKPMIFSIDPGTVSLGFHVARKLERNVGDRITIEGEEFRVTQTLTEQGSQEDVRVYAHLSDVQRVLHLEGRVNEIQALECLCRDPNVESIDVLRAELGKLMPEAKVIQLRGIAQARERQRIMAEKYFTFTMYVVVTGCALWIGVLAMLNVRDRRQEIGVMRALGFGMARIGALFIGKALVLGLVGALLGFVAGTVLALRFGPGIFEVTASAIEADYAQLWRVLICAPLFAAICSMIPAAIAVADDPAATLRED